MSGGGEKHFTFLEQTVRMKGTLVKQRTASN